MSIDITTTKTDTGNASTTDRLSESDRELDLEHKLADLIEQHAARPRCDAPNCFSSEGVAYVGGNGDGGEDVPLCRDCRNRYGVGL